MSEPLVLQARYGIVVCVRSDSRIRVVNLHGQQVVDTWALSADDQDEFMSMEHTRSCLDKLGPVVGDHFFTNRRRPILLLEADTSPGIHDTLLSACDEDRYRLLGFKGQHRSCVQNFHEALAEVGVRVSRVPAPWNMFENVVIKPDRSLAISPPAARPGDTVTLRALMDAVVIFSTCPMDIVPTNGLDCTPKDVELQIE